MCNIAIIIIHNIYCTNFVLKITESAQMISLKGDKKTGLSNETANIKTNSQ